MTISPQMKAFQTKVRPQFKRPFEKHGFTFLFQVTMLAAYPELEFVPLTRLFSRHELLNPAAVCIHSKFCHLEVFGHSRSTLRNKGFS